jgi:uncharacterized membrane protein YbjE (DUF340 family)
MKNQRKELVPLILLFIIFNNFFLFGKGWLAKHGLDYLVLIIANSIFFVASLLVYQMQKRAVKNPNPNVFVRAVMGGTMIKMVICLIAVAIYALAFKNIFSKMSVFAAMGLYFFYLVIEVRMATNLNKKKNA